jgi:DNA-binding transcriptional regulator YiaG
MPYRYKESGLDDVLLPRSAYTIRKTSYGETVAIHNVDRLHREIATKLVRQSHLTGAALRFLRLEMDQTQAELAETLGTSEQTLSLWERDHNKPMPKTAGQLLRIIAAVRLRLGLRLANLAAHGAHYEPRVSSVPQKLRRSAHWPQPKNDADDGGCGGFAGGRGR